jgi:hypothetical protein
MSTFYCANCQTPELCQVVCLYEQMEGRKNIEGDLADVGEFIGKPVIVNEMKPDELNEIVKAVINS